LRGGTWRDLTDAEVARLRRVVEKGAAASKLKTKN